MKVPYQLVCLGLSNPLENEVVSTFRVRIKELGLNDDAVRIVHEDSISSLCKAPIVVLYYGGVSDKFPHLDLIDRLLKGNAFVLPVATDIEQFSKQIPEPLRQINGFELSNHKDIEPLVSCILEGFSLLRLFRRLFISYRRTESRSAAIQLYERLEEAGFDVFLDTHSIRPGEIFQDELWHRLVDTDVVVLLNTPGFLTSKWTEQELAKASAMSIGILQLVWPGHKPERPSELSTFSFLKEDDFEGDYADVNKCHLKSHVVENIVSQAESIRARSLAARQDNLIAEFLSASRLLSKPAYLQPDRFITVEYPDDKEIIVIPTVGVPHAFSYQQSEDLVNRIKKHGIRKAYLLYDHRNIREKWLNHLNWLDGYLPVRSVKVTDVENWLKNVAP